MDLFRREELNELIEHQTEPCLSIYLPTHRTGRDAEQDPIRLKNLLRESEAQLIDRGVRGPEARDLLNQATQLLGDPEFWRQRSDGLALFFAPQFHRRYRVPLTFDEMICLNRRFYIHPLLPLLQGDGHFYVLGLSQKKIRLYRGTRQGLDEIEVEGMPENLDDALQNEDEQNSLQHRSWGPRASGIRRSRKQSLGAEPAGGVVFHGQGADQDVHKRELGEFLSQVAHAVDRKLHAEKAPLVLACVDYEAPIYREHARYSDLLDEIIAGNPEQWNLTELHRRAWTAVEPHFRKTQQEALSKFLSLPADRISNDLKAIAEAAEQGRVEAFFIASSGGNGSIARQRVGASPKDEMLDQTATAVLRNGGDVFMLAPDAMPENAKDVAAVFRYAVS